MEVKVHFDKVAVSDFTALLNSYSVREFASPYRSTIPLLSLIKDGQLVLRDILAACLMTPPMDYHFEFTVEPPKGRGKASHTDLMVQSGSRCLAIEAKWTEPIYPTVAAWVDGTVGGNRNSRSGETKNDKGGEPKKRELEERRSSQIGEPKNGREEEAKSSEAGKPENREKVLSGWLSLLKPHARRDLLPDDFADCTYQMVHRAASACFASKQPQLAYFKFAPSVASAARFDDYLLSLELLHGRLGNPIDYPFFLVEIQIAPTEAFRCIENLTKGESDTAVRVRNALRDSKLFEFLRYRITQIAIRIVPEAEEAP
jgi:hypothetical protein